jgi:hypothetical protein
MESEGHYRVYKSPPLISILNQINPGHALTPCFFKIHFNIIFISTFKSSKWSLPIQICRLKLCMHFSSLICMRHGWTSLRPGQGLGQAQPGAKQIGFLFFPPFFYLKMEAESSFRNVVILLFYNLDDGKKSKRTILLIITHHRQKPSDFV